MEQLKATKKQLEHHMTTATKIMEIIAEKQPDEKNLEFITRFYLSFALLTQSYSMFLLNYRLAKHSVKTDIDAIKKFHDEFTQHYKDLKHCAETFKSKRIGELLTTKTGSSDLPDFYEQHHAQFEKWVKKPPTKEKLIATLELWTGAKGEFAVMSVLKQLRKSSTKLVQYISQVYGMRFEFNEALNVLFTQTFQNLINYYVQHRNKYIGNRFQIQRIEFGQVLRFALRDDYIKLNMEFRKCSFSQFFPYVERIIKALNEIDVAIGEKMAETILEELEEITLERMPDFDPNEEAGWFVRRDAKKEIIEAAKIVAENLECMETPVTKFTIKGDVTVEAIMKSVEGFLEVEKEAVAQASEIRNIFKLQAENMNELSKKIEFLTGPSTDPCVRRIFYHLIPVLVAEYHNQSYNKTAWENCLGFKWKKLLSSNRRSTSPEFSALLSHLFSY